MLGHGYPRKGHVRANPAPLTKRGGGKTKAPPGQYPDKKETGEHMPSLCQPACQDLDTSEVVRSPRSAKNSKGKSRMKAAACQWPRSS